MIKHVYRSGLVVALAATALSAQPAAPASAGHGSTNPKPILQPAGGDFDDDGRTDLTVWRPSNGTWYSIRSRDGFVSRQFGTKGDWPYAVRKGIHGPAYAVVFRPTTGTFWKASLGGADSATRFNTGAHFLLPVAADYNGDRAQDWALWDAVTGEWTVWGSGPDAKKTFWGQSFDRPVPADYDGDGKADLAVWRRFDGMWHIINSSNGAVRSVQWGQDGDRPVPGDYNHDGKADLAVWRPSNGTWYVRLSGVVETIATQGWGQEGDIPVPGDFDGDRATDFAVWRPSNGTWYIIESRTRTTRVVQWGQDGDVPIV